MSLGLGADTRTLAAHLRPVLALLKAAPWAVISPQGPGRVFFNFRVAKIICIPITFLQGEQGGLGPFVKHSSSLETLDPTCPVPFPLEAQQSCP